MGAYEDMKTLMGSMTNPSLFIIEDRGEKLPVFFFENTATGEKFITWTRDKWFVFLEDLYSYILVIMGIENFNAWLLREKSHNKLFHQCRVDSDGDLLYFDPIEGEEVDVSDIIEDFWDIARTYFNIAVPENPKEERSALYDLFNVPQRLEMKYNIGEDLRQKIYKQLVRFITVQRFSNISNTKWIENRYNVLKEYGKQWGLNQFAPFSIVKHWRMFEANQFPNTPEVFLAAFDDALKELRKNGKLQAYFNDSNLERLEAMRFEFAEKFGQE